MVAAIDNAGAAACLKCYAHRLRLDVGEPAILGAFMLARPGDRHYAAVQRLEQQEQSTAIDDV